MRSVRASICTFVVFAFANAAGAAGQTVVIGNAMALKSSGAPSGNGWTLSQDGYLGTYITLDQSGQVRFDLNAAGSTSNGVASDMTITIANSSQSFSLPSSNATNVNYTSPVLPAGTYFVRTQLDNHKTLLQNNVPVASSTTLTLNSLTVNSATAGTNVVVVNSGTDALALAAANTYIDHFRKGTLNVAVLGAPVGARVQISQSNSRFNLGTYVPGGYSSTDNYLLANPAPNSDADNFQQFINGRFNSIVPSNAGKWERNETVSVAGGVVTNSPTAYAGIVDQMMAYANANGMSARQHNLIWGSQQPTQVVTWLKDAATQSATHAQSLAYVQQAIANRIANYTQGTNTVDGHVRAADFQQLDVLNEALQTGNYQALLGYNGIADIYKATQDAVKAKGLRTKLYTNEYNVLQNSPITVTPSSTYGKQAAATYGDNYANWYRNEVENINNAGLAHSGALGNVVTGIGVQYYPTGSANKGPAIIQQAMQNLSVEGLPISLTEFGGQVGTNGVKAADAPQLLDDTIRMMMGTPNVDTMMDWGWYDDGTASTNNYGGGTVLVNKGWKNADGTWNLTAAGKRFEYLFGRGIDPTAPGANADGSNPDPLSLGTTTQVSSVGTINFIGLAGDYNVSIDGVDYPVQIQPDSDGTNNYVVVVPEPYGVAFLVTFLFAGNPRRFRIVKRSGGNGHH